MFNAWWRQNFSTCFKISWKHPNILIMLKVMKNNMCLFLTLFTWQSFVSSINGLNYVLNEIFIIWRLMPNLKNILCTYQSSSGQSAKQPFFTFSSIINTTILPFKKKILYSLYEQSDYNSKVHWKINSKANLQAFPTKNNKQTCGQSENTAQHNNLQPFCHHGTYFPTGWSSLKVVPACLLPGDSTTALQPKNQVTRPTS